MSLSACVPWGGPGPLADAVSTVQLIPDGDNVLRGALEVESHQPTGIRVELHSEDHALAVVDDRMTTEHDVPLLQLRAGREYEVRVELLDGSGNAVNVGEAGTFTTGPLPADLPPVTVERADVDAMTPGLTLFDQTYRPPKVEDAEPAEDEGFLTAVDETGQVVWYHREPLDIQEADRLTDGDLLFISDEAGARRITPTGETVAEWRGTSPGSPQEDIGQGLPDGEVIDVDAHSMHHEIIELPDGNLVTLSREMREITYPEPLCEDGEGPSVEQVVGDVVVVFDPGTGEVVAEHPMFDTLDPLADPRRLPGDLCISYLDRHFPDAEPRDWTHGNGVIPIDDGDKWLVSLRYTDELVAETSYSRAVRYRIDPEAGSAEQVWEHDLDRDVYALFVGDADMLDGTALITHGGQSAPCEPAEDDGATYVWGQIIEVAEETGDVVFDLRTKDPVERTGWAIYRAERIPTIHPPEFDVEVLRHGPRGTGGDAR